MTPSQSPLGLTIMQGNANGAIEADFRQRGPNSVLIFTEALNTASGWRDVANKVIIRETRYAHRPPDVTPTRPLEWSPGWLGTHDPAQQAQHWMRLFGDVPHNGESYHALAGHFAAAGKHLYLLANNERDAYTPATIRQLAAFERELLKLMQAAWGHNVILIGWNRAVGTTNDTLTDLLDAYIDEASAGSGHLPPGLHLGFHDYGAVFPWGAAGDNQVGDLRSTDNSLNAQKARALNRTPFPTFDQLQPAYLTLGWARHLTKHPGLHVHVTEFAPSDRHAADFNTFNTDGQPTGGLHESAQWWHTAFRPTETMPAYPGPAPFFAALLDWQMDTYHAAAAACGFTLESVSLFALGDNYNHFNHHDLSADGGKFYWKGLKPHLQTYAPPHPNPPPPPPPPAPPQHPLYQVAFWDACLIWLDTVAPLHNLDPTQIKKAARAALNT